MAKKSKSLIYKEKRIQKPSELFKFKGNDGKLYGLNLQQKKFAELYLEYQGNGTDAIIDAGYHVRNSRGFINRGLAGSMANEYLKKPDVYMYISTLLSKFGFAEENVDKQHLFLINQFGDLSAKAKGIDMFNRLKGRYPKDQAITDALKKYQGMSDDELLGFIEGEVVKDDE
jgi:hypothetical protein